MAISIQTILYLNYFVLAVFTSGLSVVILQLVVNYGIDAEVAGSLVGFKSLFVLIPSLGSFYILKLGYKKSMLFGLLGVTVASLFIAIIRNFWAVLFLFAIGGFSHTLIKLSVYSTIGLVSRDRQQHTSLMNKVEGTYIIGGLFEPLLFSWAIQWRSWSDAYLIIAVLTALAFVLLLKTDLDESEAIQTSAQPKFSQMLRLLNYSLVWIFILCILLSRMLELGFKTWLPTFYTEVFKLSQAQSVLFLSIFTGGIALSRFSLAYLQERFPWVVIQIANLGFGFILTLAILTLAVARDRSVMLLAFSFALVGFFFGSLYPTIYSIMLSKFFQSRHISISGLIVIFAELGLASGVAALGFLSKHFSIHHAFYIMLLPLGILPFLLIIYNKLIKRFNSLI